MIDELGFCRDVIECAHLKIKFEGVYSADNFPVTLKENTFALVIRTIQKRLELTGCSLAIDRTNTTLETHYVCHLNLTRTFPFVWIRLISV